MYRIPGRLQPLNYYEIVLLVLKPIIAACLLSVPFPFGERMVASLFSDPWKLKQ
jgi:hypothetical protein